MFPGPVFAGPSPCLEGVFVNGELWAGIAVFVCGVIGVVLTVAVVVMNA